MTEISPHLLEEKCAPCSGAHLGRVALSSQSHPFRKTLLVLPLSPRSLLFFVSFFYCFLWSRSIRIERPVWLSSREGMQKGSWREIMQGSKIADEYRTRFRIIPLSPGTLTFFFFFSKKEFSSLPSNNLPYLQESKEELFTTMTTHQEREPR